MDKAQLDWLIELININLQGEGIYPDYEFDLDVNLEDDWRTFTLWTGDDDWVDIPLEVNVDNAKLIQEAVRRLGREVMHTWGMQYSTDPEVKPFV